MIATAIKHIDVNRTHRFVIFVIDTFVTCKKETKDLGNFCELKNS